MLLPSSGRLNLGQVDACSMFGSVRCQTPTKHTINISEPLRISVKYSFILPDDETRRSDL